MSVRENYRPICLHLLLQPQHCALSDASSLVRCGQSFTERMLFFHFLKIERGAHTNSIYVCHSCNSHVTNQLTNQFPVGQRLHQVDCRVYLAHFKRITSSVLMKDLLRIRSFIGRPFVIIRDDIINTLFQGTNNKTTESGLINFSPYACLSYLLR